MAIYTRYAARSDVGLIRSSNQDSGYAGDHLLVLADGMGGPAGGDIASSVAVAHLAPLDDTHGADELLGLLRHAIADAHADLVARSTADPDLAGLGTTCIALLRTGSKLAMVHIGDSRAYLLRDGELTQVTTDHTFVQYLVSTGRLTEEEAERHPQRNMILRALGDTEGEVELDESMREIQPGDRWLLSSDGLFGVVSKETIQSTLAEHDDPGAAADALVALSLRAGAPDNVTCVVADFLSDGGAPHPMSVPQVVGSAAERPTRRRGRAPAARAAAGRAPRRPAPRTAPRAARPPSAPPRSSPPTTTPRPSSPAAAGGSSVV
jgi:protein phosphatase